MKSHGRCRHLPEMLLMVLLCTSTTSVAALASETRAVQHPPHAVSAGTRASAHRIQVRSLNNYLDKRMGASPADYSCNVAPHQENLHGCANVMTPGAQHMHRAFGILYSRSRRSGFLFIADKHGGSVTIRESRTFHIDIPGLWSVESIDAESDDRFRIQTTSGSASMPDMDVYRFARIDGTWVLSGHDHRTLDRCPDGSIDRGDRYSIDFLTGKTIVDAYRDCRHRATRIRHGSRRTLRWSSFDPATVR